MQSRGKPAFSIASRIISAIALFELIASLPPRRITALPAFKHSAAASEVTFGRASNMMPITPIGTVTFSICSPFLSVLPSRILPIGSGRAATCKTPSAIPLILSSVSLSLSRRDAVSPAFFPFSMSMSFAFMIVSEFALRASAIAVRASSFFEPAFIRKREASLAFAPIISSCVIVKSFLYLLVARNVVPMLFPSKIS